VLRPHVITFRQSIRVPSGNVDITLAAAVEGRSRIQFSHLHRMWRMRGCLSQCFGESFRRCEDDPPGFPAPAMTRLACEFANNDTVFIAEVGLITGWAARQLRLPGTQPLLDSFNHGSLGVALPGTLGVQLLDRDRQVVALAGDGGFGMIQDFITAVRYKLSGNFIVYGNEKWGSLKLKCRRWACRNAERICRIRISRFIPRCAAGRGSGLKTPPCWRRSSVRPMRRRAVHSGCQG
jgi:thiamine pyrophosphate-dependent acetolactate synthase large subunit-like protein